MNVEDINAVITGGSSGLGKATAEIILSNGGKATILDTQKDIGEEFARSSGQKCAFLYTDVTDEKSVADVIKIVVQEVIIFLETSKFEKASNSASLTEPRLCFKYFND